jgi:hypothetical protein
MDESSFAWIDENTRELLEVALHLDEPSVMKVWGCPYQGDGYGACNQVVGAFGGDISHCAHHLRSPRSLLVHSLLEAERWNSEDNDPGIAAFFSDIGANVATIAAWSPTINAMAGTLNLLNTQPAAQ